MLNFGDYFCVGEEASVQKLHIENNCLEVSQNAGNYLFIFPFPFRLFKTYRWEKDFKPRVYVFEGTDLGRYQVSITPQDGEFKRYTITKFVLNISYFNNGILFDLKVWSDNGDYICYGADIENKNSFKPLNENLSVFIPLDKLEMFSPDNLVYIEHTKKAIEQSDLQAYKL